MDKDAAHYWSKKPLGRMEKNAFVEKALSFLKGSERVLDLGCGRGLDTLEFARYGCIVTALDISNANISFVREKARSENYALDLIQHDLALSLPFDAGSFDVVYAHLSLHYFDDTTTKRIFSTIKNVLIPGGLLFVKCKSTVDALYGQGEKVGADMFRKEHVRHFFSEDYMRECLCDFEIIEIVETASVYEHDQSAFIEAVARS